MKIKISYNNPINHIITIRLTFDELIPTKLQLPAWRPGRYELQNFAQNITNLNFSDGKEELDFQRKTKDLWVIDEAPKRLIVTYDYYAKQMDAGGTWLDNQQLYINFVTCIFQGIGTEREVIQVELDVPLNFDFATSLKQDNRLLIAQNYYELVDSPVIAAAEIKHHQFKQEGCIFHIWMNGKCKPNWEKLEQDFKQFGEEQIQLFGEFPCKEYHYLFQLLPYTHYHGVEHSQSTVITLGPGKELNGDKMQTDLLGISSHELFHTWNVCRIKPEEFLPNYDFSKETYYETGYITEGITTYYGDYMLARSGVFGVDEYFKEIDIYLKRHFENDGRHTSSLTDSSLKLWLDGYKLGVPASKSSIYIKGALAALILDLEIRKATSDDNNLDDIMQELWRVCGDKKHGYNHDFYQAIIEKITRQDFSWYFDQVIFGTKDLYSVLNNALAHVGCKITISENNNHLESQFGFRTVTTNAQTKVVKIVPDSPASKYLDLGDEIRTINKMRFADYESQDEQILLEITRLNEPYEIVLKATERPFLNTYHIQKLDDASVSQRESFELWIKKEF